MAKFIESPGVLGGMWKVATGQVHAAQDDFVSGTLGALRNMNVASSLRQAIFFVLPTDSVTQLLAANHVGMDGIWHMARVFTGGLTKDEAAIRRPYPAGTVPPSEWFHAWCQPVPQPAQ